MGRSRNGERREAGWGPLPMVNLVTLLVPVALMVGQAIGLRVLRAADPGIAGENPGDAVLAVVEPVVEVSGRGFRIRGAEDVLAGPEGRPSLPCADGACGRAGAYDYQGLRRLLGHVKSAYPWADEVTFEAADGMPTEVLSRAIEAVRADPAGRELFPKVRLRSPGSEAAGEAAVELGRPRVGR